MAISTKKAESVRADIDRLLETGHFDLETAIQSIADQNGVKPQSIRRYYYLAKSTDKEPLINTVNKTELIDKPIIEGITADENTDFEKEILPYLMHIGDKAKDKTEKEKEQIIDMGDKPFAIAILSDVHGGAKADYKAIKDDLDIIESNDRLFAITAGDLTDNYIIGKLQSIQKHQSTTFDMETRFLRWFFEKLKGSLIAVCSGNHDNWTTKLTAIDPTKELIKGVKCLYDSTQVQFTLKYGKYKHKYMVRHKYKHSSIFNPSHGMEVFWERGTNEYDVAIAGHTHIATLCRPFIKHDKERFAVLLGTYKMRDEFGRECGFADTHSESTGSGAMCYNPKTGQVHWTRDLQTASDLINVWGK